MWQSYPRCHSCKTWASLVTLPIPHPPILQQAPISGDLRKRLLPSSPPNLVKIQMPQLKVLCFKALSQCQRLSNRRHCNPVAVLESPCIQIYSNHQIQWKSRYRWNLLVNRAHLTITPPKSWTFRTSFRAQTASSIRPMPQVLCLWTSWLARDPKNVVDLLVRRIKYLVKVAMPQGHC